MMDLSSKHRKVIEIYLNAMNDVELKSMIEDYNISKTTYHRYIDKGCLELSQLLDYRNIITLKKINKEIK